MLAFSGSVLEIEFYLLHHPKDFIPFFHEEKLNNALEDFVFEMSHGEAGAKLGFNSMKLSLIVVRRLKLNILVPFIVFALPDSSNQAFSFLLLSLS